MSTPGRKPPRKQRRAAERDAARKRRRGKQPGAPGSAMTSGVPDDTWTISPRAPARAARTWRIPPTWGIAVRPAARGAEPERQIDHDLYETRCACGKTHVAPRPAGVLDSAVSIGPRLRLAAYLLVSQHLPVERCQMLLPTSRRGGVCRVHPLLPAQGRVDRRQDRQADQDPAHRLQGRGSMRPRCGPGRTGEKKYVHGAFTESTRCSTSAPVAGDHDGLRDPPGLCGRGHRSVRRLLPLDVEEHLRPPGLRPAHPA